MIDTPPRPDASLPDFLAARARRASDNRLVTFAAVGLVAMIVIALWRGPGWLVLLPLAACLLAFGGWGIADRELAERPVDARAPRAVLRAVRVAFAGLGFIAAIFMLMVILAGTLGRIIS